MYPRYAGYHASQPLVHRTYRHQRMLQAVGQDGYQYWYLNLTTVLASGCHTYDMHVVPGLHASGHRYTSGSLSQIHRCVSMSCRVELHTQLQPYLDTMRYTCGIKPRCIHGIVVRAVVGWLLVHVSSSTSHPHGMSITVLLGGTVRHAMRVRIHDSCSVMDPARV